MRGSVKENLWSSIAREDIYKVACALSRELSRARHRAQRDYLTTLAIVIWPLNRIKFSSWEAFGKFARSESWWYQIKTEDRD